MNWERTESEFDRFAQTLEWIFDEEKSKTPLNPGCRSAIERAEPCSILDCACGPGWGSIALKKAGYCVHGSDISSEMIRLARSRARRAGVEIPFTVAGWHELSSRIAGRFDFVMCHGNAIGHCQGEHAMLESLQAMRAVTKDGGYFYLDTRSWEWFRTRSARFWGTKSKIGKDRRHTIINVATIPRRWSGPHLVEVVHILDRDGELKVEGYPVTFYAFKIGELFERLRQSGFGSIETDYRRGNTQYWVVAQAV